MMMMITIEIDLWWFRHYAGLEIYETFLTSLDLDSLQEIRNGHVIITENSELCYADGIDWRRLISNRNNYRSFVVGNRNRTLCGKYFCSGCSRVIL